MAKYKLTDNGVYDTEVGVDIPNDPKNRHWQEYQEWLGGPNVPDAADVPSWDNEGRGIRDHLLSETDWTRSDDAPLDFGTPTTKREDFATYRQELRDLPATYPDYSTVVWPTKPTYPE